MSGHHPRRKRKEQNEGGPLSATATSPIAAATYKSALAKTDHAAVREIPHLAFSLETGDTRGRLCGQSWQAKTMSYQACKSARCTERLTAASHKPFTRSHHISSYKPQKHI